MTERETERDDARELEGHEDARSSIEACDGSAVKRSLEEARSARLTMFVSGPMRTVILASAMAPVSFAIGLIPPTLIVPPVMLAIVTPVTWRVYVPGMILPLCAESASILDTARWLGMASRSKSYSFIFGGVGAAAAISYLWKDGSLLSSPVLSAALALDASWAGAVTAVIYSKLRRGGMAAASEI